MPHLTMNMPTGKEENIESKFSLQEDVIENPAVAQAQTDKTAGTDKLTILTHPTNLLCKSWLDNGTVKGYDSAKVFQLQGAKVCNVRELSLLLRKLESQHRSCLIRGRYCGDDVMRKADANIRPGFVRRLGSVFEEQSLHTTLIEVDDFLPKTADPVLDPEKSALEYIATCLPSEFQNCAFHWQLSNSAGHPSKAGIFKAHLWFWLKTPYISARLKTWAMTSTIKCDASVFSHVQIHYTAKPVFAKGVIDPVPVRSGFFEGLSDSVDLKLPPLLPARSLSTMRQFQDIGDAYIRAAVRRGVDTIANAAEGTRNAVLYQQARSLMRFAQSGGIGAQEIAASLYAAACASGLDHREVVSTIASAIRARGLA